MAIVQMLLDPNAATYTDDQIVGKVNTATVQITRSGAIDSAALESGAAKANLDAMADLDRGYVKTDPAVTQFKVIAIQRAADGKLEVDYDNVAV